MIEPKIGEKVTINGVTYECAEPSQGGWMCCNCDLYNDRCLVCIDCPVQCSAYYRKDGKNIILKRTSK